MNESGKTDDTNDTDEQLWPMGAVTRRTGIGEHTLRAWERRFGFPTPRRLASGHRRYTADQVRQLLLINDALRCGYRAGDVVPLSRERLAALLEECGQAPGQVEKTSPEWLREVLDATREFDRGRLLTLLYGSSMTLGIPRFVRERVRPLLVELGEAWARGDLQIRHEHFFSETLEDVLRDLRGSVEATGGGRPVVLASFPTELHALGLHVAALAVAATGRRSHVLGPRTPVEEIAQAAASVDAAAVGVSISLYTSGEETSNYIADLRTRLPSRIRLWLGGAGSRELSDLPADVEVLDSFDDLDRALRELAD